MKLHRGQKSQLLKNLDKIFGYLNITHDRLISLFPFLLLLPPFSICYNYLVIYIKKGETVFKNIISPIQAWLLSQGKCVGCGMPLSKANHEYYQSEEEKVICKCQRVYIYNTKTQKYRRALLTEA